MPKNNIVKTDGTIDYNHLGVMDDNITSNSNQIGIVRKNRVYASDYDNLKVAVSGGYDYAPPINAALTACGNVGGGVVVLPSGIVQYGQDLNIPSGVTLEGVAQSSITSTIGTQLIRIAAVSIKLIGTTILSGTPTRYNEFNKIRFNGNGFSTTDLMVVKAAGVVLWNDCFLSNTNARLLYAQELMDSRFNNCWFEQGGSADGVTPAVEFVSEGGYEYTNQVQFTGCRFEKYNGTALKTTNNNTNEISFTDTKFESLISNVSHIIFNNTNTINFNGLQLCSRGSAGSTIPSQILFNNCKGITGTLLLEHTGTIDTNAAKIDRFVDIKSGTTNIDLCVYVYTNGVNTLQANPVIVDATNYSPSTTSIRGSVLGSGKPISNVSYAVPNTALVHGNGSPSVRIQYDPVANEYWDIRVVSANGISELQFIHGTGGSETTVWKVTSLSELLSLTSLTLANSPTTPSNTRNGMKYLDTSVTPNCERMYVGSNWRRIGWSASFSMTGTWNTGDIVYNATPTETGTAGSKYIVQGWRRMNFGSGQVLGTDWMEMRMLTGN